MTNLNDENNYFRFDEDFSNFYIFNDKLCETDYDKYIDAYYLIDYEGEDVNDNFRMYLDDQIDKLKKLNFDVSFKVDIECDTIKHHRNKIRNTYNITIKELFELLDNEKKLLFVHELCLNPLNKDMVIEYLSIFEYVHRHFNDRLSEAYHFISKYLNSESMFDLSKRR